MLVFISTIDWILHAFLFKETQADLDKMRRYENGLKRISHGNAKKMLFVLESNKRNDDLLQKNTPEVEQSLVYFGSGDKERSIGLY